LSADCGVFGDSLEEFEESIFCGELYEDVISIIIK
jgi:hypothetical protein